MRSYRLLISSIVLCLAAGCGNSIVGTYKPEARVIEGKTEAPEPGYSLEEIRKRLVKGERTLTFNKNGRYVWRTDNIVNEGPWRRDGDKLILRDDTQNGHRIGADLQLDREMRVLENGEILNVGAYNRYNIEEVYVLQ